jgi:hypothetical protein
MNYVQNVDGNTLLYSTGIVLVAYISSYIYRKLRAATNEVVEVMEEAHKGKQDELDNGTSDPTR